ncbi:MULTISPECIES: MarR family winged helix-turn-helix transcriptional regulator [unclassified Streptomyces]|uniref:MarR family winged helix-turn-helix transcriptional regulator n=1 Tax=unclassified Streptomyces TaxID=2593676 RepID=UPI002E1F9401|nr:MarR family transcriptional regulator [Streptomyces sp. NBC_01023]
MTQDGSAEAATAATLLGREFASAVVNFHETVGKLMGLRASERKCLDTLMRLGPVTAGTIAEHTGLTSGAVTGLVDRLESAGYARRTRDPGDRRRVLIELVPNERLNALQAAVFGPFGADMGSTTAGYDEAELRAILSWIRKATDVLIANTARVSEMEGLK